MYQKFGIKKEILDLSEEVEKEIQPIFKNIEKIEEINSLKVLSAFQECGLSEMHLNSSTGYGIDEIGRNKIEEIYAKIFNAEDALVDVVLNVACMASTSLFRAALSIWPCKLLMSSS